MKRSSEAPVRRVTYDGNASRANFCSSLLLSSAPACPGGLHEVTVVAGVLPNWVGLLLFSAALHGAVAGLTC